MRTPAEFGRQYICWGGSRSCRICRQETLAQKVDTEKGRQQRKPVLPVKVHAQPKLRNVR